jgi:hypothetical protein
MCSKVWSLILLVSFPYQICYYAVKIGRMKYISYVMVLLSVLILTSMSFPAFVRRGTLVVFVLFVLLEGLIFFVYYVVFFYLFLDIVIQFRRV